MFEVYILRSQGTGRTYVGFATDPVQRLGQHSAGITKSTKNRGPWELGYRELHETRAAAMQRERYLKTGRGREEIKKLVTLQGLDLHP